MTISMTLKEIAWGRILFLIFLFIIPNYLIMKIQLAGPVDDLVALATALDLVILLPLTLYFWGFKKRFSWLVLGALVFWGLILANWMIPSYAEGYLSYFNYSVIILEAGIIVIELILFVSIIKRFPLLIKNYKKGKGKHCHFLLSFSSAIERTFSFKNQRLNKFQFILRILATDIAAIYYSLFSWRKKAPNTVERQSHCFTFHKDGSYLGVFLLLVHAMTIEVIAVHFIVAQFSHTLAWIITGLDVYALLFIIADYQAIRLSPVILNSKGIHFQKGIRQYGFVPWKYVMGVKENTKLTKELEKEQNSIQLALLGLEIEKERIPYVIELNEEVEIHQLFGFKKRIQSIYIRMDDVQKFNETIRDYVNEETRV